MIKLILLTLSALYLINICHTKEISLAPLVQVDFKTSSSISIKMKQSIVINVDATFNPNLIPKFDFEKITLMLVSKTVTPKDPVVTLSNGNYTIDKRSLVAQKYFTSFTIEINADYIGRAQIYPKSVHFTGKSIAMVTQLIGQEPINVTVEQSAGIFDQIFFISIIILIVITYMNIGAQLDRNQIEQIVKRPTTALIGLLLTIVVMPFASWFVGFWLLRDEMYYRIGSFVFACCPAASASTLWTVMLDSDKELSVSLQVISTFASIVAMPLLLYILETSMQSSESMFKIQVPYSRLAQSLFLLLVALCMGWHFIGTNKKAQDISRRIFRPLTFSVLLYIIIFSSILYWHVYQLFDWTITYSCLIITVTTYAISGVFGYLINFNIDQAIAISIGSTYKNSGIAFAVLWVAFGSPDMYIAYVPCLTQVITTSLTLYTLYIFKSIRDCIQRRGQLEPIQAVEEADDAELQRGPKEVRSDSNGGESTKSDNDEFIALNVTDVLPESQTSTSMKAGTHETGPLRDGAGRPSEADNQHRSSEL